jgi:hypothetical protein
MTPLVEEGARLVRANVRLLKALTAFAIAVQVLVIVLIRQDGIA